MKIRRLKGPLICIAVAVGLLLVKDNLGVIWSIICLIATALTPFIYGFIIAYILNFFYKFLQRKVLGKVGKENLAWQKAVQPLSLVLTYLLVLGIIVLLICVIAPQLTVNITGLIKSLPDYFVQFQQNVNDLIQKAENTFGLQLTGISSFNDLLTTAITYITGGDLPKFTQNMVDAIFPAVVGTSVGIYNWVIGIIISIYLLISKDRLCMQMKRLTVAIFPIKFLPKIYEFVDVMDTKCGRFLVGKVLDSTIIGVMCFLCMSVLNLEYALLISFIVAVCNIIPFFGPFLSAVPCSFLLLMIDPIQCIIFVIMIIVLQQIDGNFIGPKVVGSKVGLFGFWTLFSVIFGGALFGFPGLILGTPIFAAFYALIGKSVNNVIKEKGSIAQQALDFEVLRYTEIAEQQKKAHQNKSEKTQTIPKFLQKEFDKFKKVPSQNHSETESKSEEKDDNNSKKD